MPRHEEFEYDGIGSIPPQEFRRKKPRPRALLLDVTAIFPVLDQIPIVDRLEHEILQSSYGWSPDSGLHARNGWQKRIGEICQGFDAGVVFGHRAFLAQGEHVRSAMVQYLARHRATWLECRGRGSVHSPMELVDALEIASELPFHWKSGPQEFVAYVNQSDTYAEELRKELLSRSDALSVTVKQVHPTLGLLSPFLPLPEEFDDLDDWLEQVAPLPGTLTPKRQARGQRRENGTR